MAAPPAPRPSDNPLAAIEAPPNDIDALEMVALLRGATALWLLMVKQRVTTKQLAAELGITQRHARNVMQRLELSRRFVIVYCRPYWTLRRPEE